MAGSSGSVKGVVPLHIHASADGGDRASPLPLGRLREPPLSRVSSFLSDAQDSPSIAVRLSEPIWSGWAHIALLVHSAQLHTLLERETVGVSSARHLSEVCASRPRVQKVLEALYVDAGQLHPGATSPMVLLEETGLSSTCPLLAHYLGDPDKVYRDDHVPVVRESLEHIATLDQLYWIASQLRNDVSEGRHKYAAHKIALLYHAINTSKLCRDHLRKRIEEHFEDIKEATETAESPTLPTPLVEWIVTLCDEVHQLVLEVPDSMRNKLAPTAQYLARFS